MLAYKGPLRSDALGSPAPFGTSEAKRVEENDDYSIRNGKQIEWVKGCYTCCSTGFSLHKGVLQCTEHSQQDTIYVADRSPQFRWSARPRSSSRFVVSSGFQKLKGTTYDTAG